MAKPKRLAHVAANGVVAAAPVVEDVSSVGPVPLDPAEWAPVEHAATLIANAPARTLRNWHGAGKLPGRKIAHVLHVHVPTAQRLATEREGLLQAVPLPALAPAGSALPAPSAKSGTGDQLSGEEAATMFVEIEAGATPLDLVARGRAPAKARLAWREFAALRDMAGQRAPDAIAELREAVERLTVDSARVAHVEAMLTTTLDRCERLEANAREVAALLVQLAKARR